MSVPTMATVLRSARIGEGFHEIECEVAPSNGVPASSFAYRAGQYVIMHSDVPNPAKPGSVVKKAYSISSAPESERPGWLSFTVATVGAMSRYVASRREGDTISFSGPWGQTFVLASEERGPIHLLATGSGFSPTGALVDAHLRSSRPDPIRLWWEIDEPYHSERLAAWRGDSRFSFARLGGEDPAIPADRAATYYLAGDGRVIAAVAARLSDGGIDEARIRVEPFFNK